MRRPLPTPALPVLPPAETLAEKFWSGYSTYVVRWCPKSPDGTCRVLDDTARELLDLAITYETHGTF